MHTLEKAWQKYDWGRHNLGRNLMVNMMLSKNDRFKYKDDPREKINLNIKKGRSKKRNFLNSWHNKISPTYVWRKFPRFESLKYPFLLFHCYHFFLTFYCYIKGRMMCKRNWGRNSGHLLHNGVIKLNLPVETSEVMSNMSKKKLTFT